MYNDKIMLYIISSVNDISTIPQYWWPSLLKHVHSNSSIYILSSTCTIVSGHMIHVYTYQGNLFNRVGDASINHDSIESTNIVYDTVLPDNIQGG